MTLLQGSRPARHFDYNIPSGHRKLITKWKSPLLPPSPPHALQRQSVHPIVSMLLWNVDLQLCSLGNPRLHPPPLPGGVTCTPLLQGSGRHGGTSRSYLRSFARSSCSCAILAAPDSAARSQHLACLSLLPTCCLASSSCSTACRRLCASSHRDSCSALYADEPCSVTAGVS